MIWLVHCSHVSIRRPELDRWIKWLRDGTQAEELAEFILRHNCDAYIAASVSEEELMCQSVIDS